MMCCSLETARDGPTLHMLGTDSIPGSIAASKERFPLQCSLEQGQTLPHFIAAELWGHCSSLFIPSLAKRHWIWNRGTLKAT